MGLSSKKTNSWWKYAPCRPGAETPGLVWVKAKLMNPYHIGDDLGLFGWSRHLFFSSQLQGATELLSSLKERRLSGCFLPSTVQWLLPHLLCTVGQKAGRNTGDEHHLSRFLQAGHTQACDCIPVTQLEDTMPQQLVGFLEQRNQKQHQHQLQWKKFFPTQIIPPKNPFPTQRIVSHFYQKGCICKTFKDTATAWGRTVFLQGTELDFLYTKTIVHWVQLKRYQ